MAISLLDKYVAAPGYVLGVVKSRDNTELCLRNVPPQLLVGEKAEDAPVLLLVEGLTSVPVKEIRIFKNLKMVFLGYSDHRSALVARRNLHTAFADVAMSIDWALPRKTASKCKE